jgi:hypothetical protein
MAGTDLGTPLVTTAVALEANASCTGDETGDSSVGGEGGVSDEE